MHRPIFRFNANHEGLEKKKKKKDKHFFALKHHDTPIAIPVNIFFVDFVGILYETSGIDRSPPFNRFIEENKKMFIGTPISMGFQNFVTNLGNITDLAHYNVFPRDP